MSVSAQHHIGMVVAPAELTQLNEYLRVTGTVQPIDSKIGTVASHQNSVELAASLIRISLLCKLIFLHSSYLVLAHAYCKHGLDFAENTMSTRREFLLMGAAGGCLQS